MAEGPSFRHAGSEPPASPSRLEAHPAFSPPTHATPRRELLQREGVSRLRPKVPPLSVEYQQWLFRERNQRMNYRQFKSQSHRPHFGSQTVNEQSHRTEPRSTPRPSALREPPEPRCTRRVPLHFRIPHPTQRASSTRCAELIPGQHGATKLNVAAAPADRDRGAGKAVA